MSCQTDIDLEKFEPQRTECDQMVIRITSLGGKTEYEVSWHAIPKHTSLAITTPSVTLEQLETLLSDKAAAT